MAKEQSWKLNLDILNFTKNALEAKGTIQSIGDSKNLAGLVDGLQKTTKLLGAVGAAALAAKVVFDTALEFEHIQTVNSQFELLTKNVGLSGQAIKEELVGAAQGLADDTDIIAAANEQIVKLGVNAKKMPELMELARKSSLVTGRDIVESFNSISTAVANGNTRMLKQIGLNVNAEKALKAYASAHGKVVKSLSDEERQRALIEAVIKKGSDAYKGVNEDTQKATLTVQRLKVAVGQLKEQLVTEFGPAAVKVTSKVLEGWKNLADWSSYFLKDKTGDERIQEKYQKINELNTEIMKMKLAAKDGSWLERFMAGGEKEIERNLKLIERLKGEIETLKPKTETIAAPGEVPELDKGGGKTPKSEEQLEQEKKFNAELLKMKQQNLDDQLKMSTAYVDADGQMKYQGEELLNQKKLLLEEQTKARIKEIQTSGEYTPEQQSQMILQIKEEEKNKLIAMDQELKNIREQNLNKYVEDSRSASQGVGRAFQQGAEQNRRALTDWGATGKMVFGSFKTHASQAFMAMGAGTKKAGEAIRGMMFGVVADTAEAKGQEMLLAGIWPPNPPAIAGGAGLLALAGFLRSKAGGESSGGMGGVGGGGGAMPGGGSVEAKPEVKEAPKKAVSINVQGSYFETEQTQRRLVELIRQESDATDFSFRQIGG